MAVFGAAGPGAYLLLLVLCATVASYTSASDSYTWTKWTKWTSCYPSCGKYGYRNRTRSLVYKVAGRPYGTNYVQRQQCYERDCDEWSICSRSCGGGSRTHKVESWTIDCNRNPCQPESGCGDLDIIFVMDMSGSVGTLNYWKQKQFAVDVVRSLKQSKGNHRVGVVSYSTFVKINFHLNKYDSLDKVEQHIWTLPYKSGQTFTSGALRTMIDMFHPSHGDRKNVPNLAILITDGQSNKDTADTIPAGRTADRVGITLYAVGIGNSRLFEREMLAVVGNKRNHLIQASDFSVLKNKLNAVTNTACEKNYSYKCCIATGDPHYRTCDGAWLHYQGSCKYTMSKSTVGCSAPYVVNARHEYRGGRPNVTYLKYIEVIEGSRTIIINRNKKITINGNLWQPGTTAKGITITNTGRYAQVILSNGVKVEYDGYWTSKVCLPDSLKGQVEGLCGNFDGSVINDFKDRGGKQHPRNKAGYIKIGESWQVHDPSITQCRSDAADQCKKKEDRTKVEKLCNVIKDIQGIFGSCLPKVPYMGRFDSCVTDVCAATSSAAEMKGAACQYIEGLADECKAIGYRVGNWRTASGCGTEKWGDWGSWTACSVTCGMGSQSRVRECVYPGPGGCKQGSSKEARKCAAPFRCITRVDGQWSLWGSWSRCSKSCKTGRQTRRRTCTNPVPSGGGQGCTGRPIEHQDCNDHVPCPKPSIDGSWGSWGSWSQCCGSPGERTRYRDCNNPAPQYGGKQCPGSSVTTENCQDTSACQAALCRGCTYVSGIGYLSDPSNPSKYHKCVSVGGGRYHIYDMRCAPGTQWNQSLLICTVPQTGRGPCANTRNGFVKHPTNCAAYYRCAHGKPVLKCCRNGLRWDSVGKICNWPTPSAPCSDTCSSGKTTTTTTTTSTTTTGAGSCNKKKVADPENRKFLVVANGLTYRMQCAAGTVFNAIRCKCVTAQTGQVTPRPTRCTAGCVLHVPFDKDYKDVCEGAPVAHHNTSLLAGHKNKAVSLLRQHAKLEIHRLARWFAGRSDFTVAFWFKASGNAPTTQGLFNNGDCKIKPTIDMYLKRKGNGSTECVVKLNGLSIGSDIKVTNNKWYHAVVTFSSPNAVFYLTPEGATTPVEQARAHVQGVVRSTSAAVLMGYKCPDATETSTEMFFRGSFDEVRVYQRSLSSVEIRTLL